MTRRSRIRTAELAVVDVADAIVTARVQRQPLSSLLDELVLKVETLRQLGLPTADVARTSRRAPLTSAMAAEYMTGARARKVVGRIFQYWWPRRLTGIKE